MTEISYLETEETAEGAESLRSLIDAVADKYRLAEESKESHKGRQQRLQSALWAAAWPLSGIETYTEESALRSSWIESANGGASTLRKYVGACLDFRRLSGGIVPADTARSLIEEVAGTTWYAKANRDRLTDRFNDPDGWTDENGKRSTAKAFKQYVLDPIENDGDSAPKEVMAPTLATLDQIENAILAIVDRSTDSVSNRRILLANLIEEIETHCVEKLTLQTNTDQ